MPGFRGTLSALLACFRVASFFIFFLIFKFIIITPGQPLPWIEVHPDREISTELLASFTRYIPVATTTESASAIARGLINCVALLPPYSGYTLFNMYDKAQVLYDDSS